MVGWTDRILILYYWTFKLIRRLSDVYTVANKLNCATIGLSGAYTSHNKLNFATIDFQVVGKLDFSFDTMLGISRISCLAKMNINSSTSLLFQEYEKLYYFLKTQRFY